jgi:spermidine synthase
MFDRPNASRSQFAVFGVVFVSGASALVFETLLFRLAGLALGNSVWAVSIVLCSFMSGLALGNWFMVVRGDRFREPLKAYAALELVIGVSGLLLVFFLPALQRAFVPLFQAVLDHPWLVGLLRLGLAFTLMLAPAAAMGMTLPVLVGALTRRQAAFGRVLGGVYGWNTLGAVVGALVCERVLVESFGITGAGLVAALGNFAAAAVAFGIARRWTVKAADPPSRTETDRETTTVSARLARGRLLAAAFLFGGILLALEVIWFRFSLMFVSAFAWNLAIMLAIVLGGIGLGGLLASAWFRAKPDADRYVVPMALLGGALVAGLFKGISSGLYVGLQIPAISWLLQLFLMFPVSLVSGILFALVGQAIRRHGDSAIRATGQVTMSNTVGAACGSLAGGFLLIPLWGMEGSFFVLAGVYAVAALLAYQTVHRADRWLVAGAGVAWLAAMALFPFGATQNVIFAVPSEMQRLGVARVSYLEGLTETIQYVRRELAGEPWFYVLRTNDHSMSSTTLDSQRYMKLYVYWPIAVRPDTKDALLISYGVGSTAKALTDTRTLRSIDVVDISQEILEAGTVVYPDPTEYPLNDRRVKIHIEDGRFFLVTTPKKFDLITAEPPPPRHSGIGNLYSKEFFQLVRDRLNEGGIVTYWLPVYQLQADEAKAIQRAFSDVFPQSSLWTGNSLEWMMVGVKGDVATPSAEDFSRQWQDPIVGPELKRLGFQSPDQFGSLFIASGPRLAAWVGDTPPLVDNHPQRLRSRPTEISADTLAQYREFMDDPGAAVNFASCPVMARCWPAGLRTATRKHFPARVIVNHLLALQQPDVFLLHETLTNPLLADYAAWAMKGSASAQEIVDGLSPAMLSKQTYSPEVWWNLAASAVARGDFGLAARYMDVPYRRPDQLAPVWWIQLQVYLYLKAGEREQAAALRQLALSYTRTAEQKRSFEEFFDWARRTASMPSGE